MASRQKLGPFLLNIFFKMIDIETFVNKSCWPLKLPLKTENDHFLMACHSFGLQNIKVSFEYVDF